MGNRIKRGSLYQNSGESSKYIFVIKFGQLITEDKSIAIS